MLHGTCVLIVRFGVCGVVAHSAIIELPCVTEFVFLWACVCFYSRKHVQYTETYTECVYVYASVFVCARVCHVRLHLQYECGCVMYVRLRACAHVWVFVCTGHLHYCIHYFYDFIK